MDSRQKMLNKIEHIHIELTDLWVDYWNKYSGFNTWQFWVVLAFLVIPLIALYFFLDKRKALLFGFYGYNVHVLFTYIDVLGGSRGLWIYPYKVFPMLTTSFALDVSLVPVVYMLLYQWTLKHKKNYYIYFALLSAFFAYFFKPLLIEAGLFEMDSGATLNYLFFGYFTVALFAKVVTNIFLYFEEQAKQTG
ncbi:CBO0543 family protein [Bacillus sp. T33-2]|uniref:CBO0543 family protein n=1 Tax=Bacillus sp. T33-2 TaxID=2054168 RepID=UPI000C78E77C|nr:CBO0543 family protein [Bacillus sp. T33-2]PLR95129.1 hypothetical protein CVD19_15885 [Bacillus sp. T33-2]